MQKKPLVSNFLGLSVILLLDWAIPGHFFWNNNALRTALSHCTKYDSNRSNHLVLYSPNMYSVFASPVSVLYAIGSLIPSWRFNSLPLTLDAPYIKICFLKTLLFWRIAERTDTKQINYLDYIILPRASGILYLPGRKWQNK